MSKVCFLLVLLIPLFAFGGNTLYFYTPHGYTLLKDEDTPAPSFETLHLLRLQLKSRGIKVEQAKTLNHLTNVKAIICLDTPSSAQLKLLKKNFPKSKRILFLLEPPTFCPKNAKKRFHKWFSLIYTFDDRLVDGKKYLKFNYCFGDFTFNKSPLSFNEKKLCCLINANKNSSWPLSLYNERKIVIRFFEQTAPNDFDLYGYGWNPEECPSYRGTVIDKTECYHYYKFAFCYENLRDGDGYITEKIFDALRAGCVPIYWGARNIGCYIPDNCFIARDQFKDNNELYRFLSKISEREYQQYIDAIQSYLSSSKTYPFSIQNYYKIIFDLLERLEEQENSYFWNRFFENL